MKPIPCDVYLEAWKYNKNLLFQRLRRLSTKYRTEKIYPTATGEKEENVKKNRYKDILPCKSDLHVSRRQRKGLVILHVFWILLLSYYWKAKLEITCWKMTFLKFLFLTWKAKWLNILIFYQERYHLKINMLWFWSCIEQTLSF